MGLSIRAFATPPARALRASGQLWCSTLAAVRSTASRWDLGHRRYRLKRSLIQFEQLKIKGAAIVEAPQPAHDGPLVHPLVAIRLRSLFGSVLPTS